jgi:hypothetical protein
MTQYFRDPTPTIELYDHHTDPLETQNIALENPQLIESLMEISEKGNTGLYNK